MMKYCSLFMAALMLTATAQDQPGNQQQNRRPRESSNTIPGSWTGNFDTGTCIIKASAMTSCGKHSYVLDGAFYVTEVTVDTTGSALIRIYYIEPLATGATATGQRAADVATDMATRVQGIAQGEVINPLTVVVKNYPTTTHAHTIEYRVGTRVEIDKVFSSLQQAVAGKSGVFQATKASEADEDSSDQPSPLGK